MWMRWQIASEALTPSDICWSSLINRHPKGHNKHDVSGVVFKLMQVFGLNLYESNGLTLVVCVFVFSWFSGQWPHLLWYRNSFAYSTVLCERGWGYSILGVIRNARVYKLWLWPLDLPSSQNRREAQVLIGQDEVWNTLIGWADM